MNCPNCNYKIPQDANTCPNCGISIEADEWITIAKVYSPADLVIVSLLEAHSIPLKILKHDIAQFPVTVGPMAEVKLQVPQSWEEKARDLLKTIETISDSQ